MISAVLDTSFLGLDTVTWILMITLIIVLAITFLSSKKSSIYESFDNQPIDIMALTTQALDAPPSTSELKNHYKTLLIHVDDDLRNNGKNQSLRILADFRNRVYGRCSFRDDLTFNDVLSNWPDWMPPLDTTIKEPVPSSTDAVTAESKMLAYIVRNFPQEPSTDETSNIVRSLISDFGYRFIFKKGREVSQVAPDFTPKNLLKDWTNPVGTSQMKHSNNDYASKCIPSP